MITHNTDENSAAYRTMAPYYDVLMNANKYSEWKQIISNVIEKYHIPTKTCLDVACGTGNISRLLKELGFRIVGVDMSSDMVAVAKEKFPRETFLSSDIRNFTLDDEVQSDITLAVSFYDSLNYLLSDDDMLQAFQAVYRNIPSGTIFLFDMNTIAHVQAAQSYRPRVMETEDFYSVFRFSGEERFWILDMDIFVKDGTSYRLKKECHIERGYDQEHIIPLVKKAGFTLLDVEKEYKDYDDGVNRLSRLYFVVRKP
ncbi:MAG: class I SAM-dependent methyltransferase [Patescibacteria group bacterium]